MSLLFSSDDKSFHTVGAAEKKLCWPNRVVREPETTTLPWSDPSCNSVDWCHNAIEVARTLTVNAVKRRQRNFEHYALRH